MKYLFFILSLFFLLPAQVSDKIVRIYQDADLSNHMESSRAIQLGMETAFDEVGNKLGGFKVELVYLNHRGNVIRSKRNYQKFIDDEKALAIYSGIHSPPLIKNRTFINVNNALTLVPWAAGGPITRYPVAENWVFRLSVDDTRAGPVIINFALDEKKCKTPHLLLEDTPWGESNLRSMSAALKDKGVNNAKVTRFNWNMKDNGARVLMRDILATGTDCVILVGNAIEGVKVTNALIATKGQRDVKLISHWGITGGNFHELVPAKQREKIDLSFIQSCFAFTNPTQSDLAKSVFARLKKISKGKINDVKDLKSAVGFVHAYDLTKVLIAAVEQAGLTGDIAQDRDNIRLALENLKKTDLWPRQNLSKAFQRV